MKTALQDIRFALRMFRAKPLFYTVAVLTLAVGIGATTTIFSVVNAALLRPLPFPKPKQLLRLAEKSLQHGGDAQPVSLPNFEDWKRQAQTLAYVAAYECMSFTVTGKGAPERVLGCGVSPDFFAALGVPALEGKTLDASAQGPVAVISYSLWQRYFHGRKELIGHGINLRGRSFTLGGIMPSDFRLGSLQADIWVPLEKDASSSNRGMRYLSVIARLRPQATLEQASAELNIIAERLRRQYPDSNQDTGVLVVPLQDFLVANIRPTLLVLFAAIACVLLLACANVANMLLTRAASRQAEIGVRVALGATPRRIFRQVVTESMILAFAGGGLGIILSFLQLQFLPVIVPAGFHLPAHIGIDSWVLLFTAAASVLTGMAFGIAPMLEMRRSEIARTLVESGSRSTSGPLSRWARNALVIGEVGISLALLIAAGVLIKSLIKMKSIDPGFNSDKVITFRISLPPTAGYGDGSGQALFFQELLHKLATTSGVSEAALCTEIPFGGLRSTVAFAMSGPGVAADYYMQADRQSVSSGYFHTMRIPLLRGRDFSSQDVAISPLVTVINNAAVRRYWGKRDPIGTLITFDGKHSLEVVGVVGDVKEDALDADWAPQIYTTYLQDPAPAMTVAVKGGLSVSVARATVAAIDPDQPIYNIKKLKDMVDESIGSNRLVTFLLAAFAAVAVLLGCTGVYAVISYSTAQRTNEIGIRMAIGADRRDILKLILKQGVILTVAGIVGGVSCAALFTRFLTSFLYSVTAIDTEAYTLATIAIIAIMFLASVVPAIRAMRLDPAMALKRN